jgi:hypothetical protein
VLDFYHVCSYVGKMADAASGSQDGIICLWDVAARKEIGRLPLPQG